MYNFYLRWYGTPVDINVDKDRRKKNPGYYIKNIQMYNYHTYYRFVHKFIASVCNNSIFLL